MACPDEETLLAFVDGFLPEDRREPIERHIDSCIACALLVADAARDSSVSPDAERKIEHEEQEDDLELDLPFVPPRTMGHYVLQEELGAGAMGCVYAAWDERLDRRVALKFVRPTSAAVDATQGRQRLIREAQAIARLSHPNIIEVFEVVEFESFSGSGLCIAMELVEGLSLRDWLDTRPAISLILSAFEQAAAGLAAAHAAGVVHRDFKPDNVLVRDRGEGIEVKVMDFGLARTGALDLPNVTPPVDTSASSLLPVELTAAGSVIGTPRYMAPEQHRGEEADARSDQFAFCVALYEALFNERAFTSKDPEALGREKAQPRGRPPPRKRAVPTALAMAILRGLSPQGDDRFPSMQALVVALAEARTKRGHVPRSIFVVGVVVLASVVGGIALRSAKTSTCSVQGDELDIVWNSQRRQTIAEAFAGVDARFADDASRGALAALDDYAQRWIATKREVCTGSQHETDTLIRDRQIACLERHRLSFEATVDVLAEADVAAVRHAIALVQSLPPPHACADPTFVTSVVIPPRDDALAQEVLAWRRRLAGCVARGRAGGAHEVWEEAVRLATESETLDYLPVRAEARFVAGWLLSSVGQVDEAANMLADAFWIATQANDHGLAARAATMLIFVHAHRRAALDEAEHWARFAEAALQRDEAEPLAWAGYEYALGTALSEAGAYEPAIAAFERALERYQSAGAGHEIAMATCLNGMAGTAARVGDLQAARAGFERAVELWESALGSYHPDVAKALNNLGNVSIELEEYERASGELERALALAEHAWGTDHIEVGDVVLNLGRLYARRDRADDAHRSYLRAIDIWTERLPSHHPRLAQAHNNLGVLALGAGDPVDALRSFDAALAGWEQALGPAHPHLLMALENRADALVALDRPEEARAALERAASIVEQAMRGPEAERARQRIDGAHTRLIEADADIQQ